DDPAIVGVHGQRAGAAPTAAAGDALGAEVSLVDLEEGVVREALEAELGRGRASDRAGSLQVLDRAAGAGAEDVAGRPDRLDVRRVAGERRAQHEQKPGLRHGHGTEILRRIRSTEKPAKP